MLPFTTRCTLAAALAFGVASPAAAQLVRLTAPNATLAEEFASIRGIRELADGRLLVSDYLDERVVLVDLDRGTVLVRVGRGGGPREARLPTRLIPVPGDSTLLVDLGNNRLLLLDGAGRAARTIPVERTGVLGVRGVDGSGAFYFAIPGWAEGPAALPNDSVRIVRWNPRARAGAQEQVAVIQGDRMRSDIREPARTPRIPTVGYGAQDAWVVTDAGVLRIVRAGSYRVESRAPGAAWVMGPSYAYPTRPVTAADRKAYVEQFLATTPTSGKGEGGFSAGDVVPAPGGRLWVGRPAEDGKPVLYDLFDEGGRRVGSVELPAGRRVMAFGSRGVYVVAESELGVQHLERYPRPR